MDVRSLCQILERYGVSQRRFSLLSELDVSAVNGILKGSINPGIVRRIRLATGLISIGVDRNEICETVGEDAYWAAMFSDNESYLSEAE